MICEILSLSLLLPSASLSSFPKLSLGIPHLPFIAGPNRGKGENSEREGPSYLRSSGCAGKGESPCCNRKYLQGACTLSEEPPIIVSQGKMDGERLRASICQQVAAISKDQRQAFLYMHNIHAYRNVAEQYLEIMRTKCPAY